MKAIHRSKAAGVTLADLPDPAPREGEVVVEVTLAGVCNTDLEIAKGYMGFEGVLGHEVLGVAEGRRVTAEINCACDRCEVCRAGMRNHCPRRTVLGILGHDGGLAERIAVPRANLHPVPDAVPDEIAVFAEPLAAALHAFDDAALVPGDRALILGDGKLGLLAALALASRRGDLGRAVLAGRHAEKLAIAEAAGLEVTFEKDLGDARFDVVVEATGHPGGLARALSALRPKGTLILKSTYAGPAGVDLAPIVINELRVVGSRCGAFPRAVDALAASRIDPRPLITATYPLSDGLAAFARAGQPGVLKVLVRPS